MAITPREPGSWRATCSAKRGIALLITLIFMSVMLAFGLALASLAYKQSVLASNATQSQRAFFAADGALECTLYADQQQGAYAYSDYDSTNGPDANTIAGPAALACDGTVVSGPGSPSASWTSGPSGRLALSERISFNNDTSCADIVIYKYANPQGGRRSFVFSTGYNVSCSAISSAASGGRIVVRGIFERF